MARQLIAQYSFESAEDLFQYYTGRLPKLRLPRNWFPKRYSRAKRKVLREKEIRLYKKELVALIKLISDNLNRDFEAHLREVINDQIDKEILEMCQRQVESDELMIEQYRDERR